MSEASRERVLRDLLLALFDGRALLQFLQWPRLQWHLCWLMHVSEDPVHRMGFAQALAEGAADSRLGELARAVRAVLPARPT